ncbi:hypothetical protein BGW38_000632 [Lunasporangiospora selenospora]|uniref:Uncharacterized protein n=1 Tax=Lunasporangiospora selenospora TaxID=979761 RepID=A0A9P6G1T2_9FUNG|nr:hypothetical protein BGW38_000632 [Lunasporangiospora selenospora]
MTSYAPSLYPHSTIGSLFIMGPKTARLQRAILRRFEHMTIYPGQKAEQRADYPILWSVTVVQVPRPHRPNQRNPTIYDSDPRLSPTRKRGPRKSGGAQGGSNSRTKFMMDAMVVKMASQGVEQMQNFLKSLFEEQDAEHDNRINMMDNEEQKERHRREKTEVVHQEEGPSVVEELFGGRVVWERAFR